MKKIFAATIVACRYRLSMLFESKFTKRAESAYSG